MQPSECSFRSGDTRLCCRDEGEGPAVVLVHGWPLDLGIWEPQASELARSFRVIRLDRRGFGQSGGTPDAAADADDIEALLDHLGVAQAALVGMSQGARGAIALALRQPMRVGILVLDGPPADLAGLSGDEEDLSIGEFRGLAQARGLDAFRDALRRHPLMRLHAADARRHFEGALSRYAGRDLLCPLPAPVPPPDAAALARLAMPVLVLNGELEIRQRRMAGDRLCGLLPDAERAIVPGAGHLANLDNPRAYNDMIQSFLRRQSRAAA